MKRKRYLETVMPILNKARGKKIEAVKKAPRAGGQYLSRAVGKALESLEILQRHQAPMTLADLARRVQLSKTSAFRLLRTLESVGYLNSNSLGQYSLVPEIRSVVPTNFLMKLLRVTSPQMRVLNRELRETVSVAALFENHSEVISVIESSEVIRMINVIGHILPPNASALGKVITAFQPEPRRERLLRSYGIYRFTPNTIVDEFELSRTFERIRELGYAEDCEESVLEGICFAVPIFTESGEVPAALSTSIPKVRVRGKEHVESVLAALKACAAQIGADLAAS